MCISVCALKNITYYYITYYYITYYYITYSCTCYSQLHDRGNKVPPAFGGQDGAHQPFLPGPTGGTFWLAQGPECTGTEPDSVDLWVIYVIKSSLPFSI